MLTAEIAECVDPAAVENLDGVTRVENETGTGGTRLRITTDDPLELTKKLCALSVTQGWTLRELKPHRQTLEDVFVRITGAEEVAV